MMAHAPFFMVSPMHTHTYMHIIVGRSTLFTYNEASESRVLPGPSPTQDLGVVRYPMMLYLIILLGEQTELVASPTHERQININRSIFKESSAVALFPNGCQLMNCFLPIINAYTLLLIENDHNMLFF